jgi:hypothetical protein
MTRDTPPDKPMPRSPTLRRAAARLRRGSSARRQDEARTRRTVSSAVEELLGRYHARPLSYTQMKKTDLVTARIPLAADPMLGSALVRELTTPFSLSIGAFPWDAEPSGRGKKVGNWLHRHCVLGKRDIYARLHHRYVLLDDLDEETWRLVGRARALRSALQRAEVVKAGHLDEPALVATVHGQRHAVGCGPAVMGIRDFKEPYQRCARLTSLRRARERADAYDPGGLLPAQTVQQTGKVLAGARAALDSPMGDLEELARLALEVDDRYRAWKALKESPAAATTSSTWPWPTPSILIMRPHGESLRASPRRGCDARSLHRRHQFVP